jgi:hypothetical protein
MKVEAYYADKNECVSEIVKTYEQRGLIADVKPMLNRLLQREAVETLVDSNQHMKNKSIRLQAFRGVLSQLKEDQKLVTTMQFNTFVYLFMKEDIAVLSAFEVYLLTRKRMSGNCE